jgi:4-amino-4-deoxy-L-arabinose transferase-like glycosyltransferase
LIEPPQKVQRTYLFMVVAVALVIRLGGVAFLYPERLNPDRDHWRFAGETGRIARSLVQGRGFSSPFHADTGPTALMTPVYPFLVAVAFKIFGIYTKTSAIAILALDSLFSALTCIPVFFIALKSFGDRAALWAAWAWAFFPYAIYFSADFIWPTTLTTLMLSLVFWAALGLGNTSQTSIWVGFGLLCGLAALTDPIVLSVAPWLALWMCSRRYRQLQPWFVPSVAASLAFVAVASPWLIRNYLAFDTFIPFRDNFGLELYVGNNGNTWHFAPGGFHPSNTASEWREYQQMGELAYMRHKREQALDYIARHRGAFAVLSLRRAVYMWTNFWSFSHRYLEAEPLDPPNIFLGTTLTIFALAGLWRAFRHSAAVAIAFAIALFLFPVVYYFTHAEDYYRRPIDPLFVILAVYAVTAEVKSSWTS